jgi:hypothetical protein
MSGGKSYWENEVTSPAEFLSNPEKYLKSNGYDPHYKNRYYRTRVTYVKQFKKEQVTVIFSSGRFHGSRFINFEGPEKLVEKEVSGLELKLNSFD